MLLLVGMLSKSILRTAAVMHVLFSMETPTSIPAEISEAAVKTAECFVNYCLQHAAFLGGRGNFKAAVEDFQQGILKYQTFKRQLRDSGIGEIKMEQSKLSVFYRQQGWARSRRSNHRGEQAQ